MSQCRLQPPASIRISQCICIRISHCSWICIFSASASTGGTSLQQGSSGDCLRPFHATIAGPANLTLKNPQAVFLFVVSVYV